jgi:hypothetical protein
MSDTKKLNARIDALGKRNASVEADIQTLGLDCMVHAEEHRDIMPMCRLVNVLRRGQHQAFVSWAITYGKFVVNKEKASMETLPLKFNKDKATDIAGATENPWFTFQDTKAGGIDKAFDLQAAVKALLKKASGKVSAETLEDLKKIAVIAHVDHAGITAKATVEEHGEATY